MKILSRQLFETKITTSSDAYLPKTYIKASSARMEIYKKIAHIENEEDKADIENEITDRFGKMPPCARALTSIALVKALAIRARIKRVEQLKEEVRLYPEDLNLPVFVEVSKYDRKTVQVCGVGKNPYFSVKIKAGEDFSQPVANLIRFYIQKTQETV